MNNYYTVDKEKLKELTFLVQNEKFDYHFTSTAYFRYLVACNSDVNQAFSAMKDHVEWRKLKDVENISLDSCQTTVSRNILFFAPLDSNGHSVMCCIIRRHDKNDRDLKELENFIIFNMEKAVKMSNPDEEKVVIIMDLHGFGLKNMDYDLVKLLIDIVQTQYRECLFKIFIVNYPWIFTACWAIIKPWIDIKTVSKVEFTDFDNLKKYIDISVLPEDIFKG
jgi:hypothetical protein